MVLSTLIVGTLAALAAAARGRSPAALLTIRFEALWALYAGLVLQLGANIWAPSWLDGGAALAVLLGSNALVAYFVLGNRSLPGLPLMATGLALNVVAIAVNGAMPVSPTAADIAGFDPDQLGRVGIEWEALGPHTVLPWLGDVIPLPWARSVISVGDVLIGFGVAVLVYRGSWATGESAEPG